MNASEYESAVDRNLAGLEFISTGICPGCKECQQTWDMPEDELEQAWSTGDVCDEGSFSWHVCESCGSHLGGNRYDAHGVDADGAIVHLSVCTDCLMYLANGDLPENWN